MVNAKNAEEDRTWEECNGTKDNQDVPSFAITTIQSGHMVRFAYDASKTFSWV
jgi:hypothetical protein